MSLLNTAGNDKFHETTTSLKQTVPELKLVSDSTNTNVTEHNILKLDSHMQTMSGGNMYLSSCIIPKIDLDKRTSNKLIHTDFPASIALQTSGSMLNELKTMNQHLSKMFKKEAPKPKFEPRQPTLITIKRAIEKAQKEEEDRHKCTSTNDLNMVKSVSRSEVATSTETKNTHKIKKKKRKGKAIATTTKRIIKFKKKKIPSTSEPKLTPVSSKK